MTRGRALAGAAAATLSVAALAWQMGKPGPDGTLVSGNPATARAMAAAASPVRPAVITTAASGRVMLQLFRGSTAGSHSEVSITTIFSARTFTVLADADLAQGAEDDLRSQVKEIFSLKEIVSLGSSMVPLAGGSALLDDDGRQVAIRIEGQPVGGRAVRLVVSQMRDGREDVATSVVARYGKTIVLAGPAPSAASGDQEIIFVCLTAISPAAASSARAGAALAALR
jgi:hypothetical protein